MKKYNVAVIIIACLVLSFNYSFGQAGQWVWKSGLSTPYSPGNHGTKGIPSATNVPPALYEACEWTDLNGNFWLYGGLDNAHDVHTDLWEYDTTLTQWIWVSGPNTINDPGNYGVQGVPSSSNYPPSKGWGVASWTDLQGNFWMFGGDKTSGGAFSDLWKYDVGTGLWTWMKGTDITNQGGVYGIRGVADTANHPGSRWECVTAWTDKAGNLWLFGGIYNTFNDLWRYNIATNTWTWMKGSQLTGQPSIYGTQGVEDSSNTPGGRAAHTRWTDKCGNLWLFGGYDVVNNFYNDLWRYNPVTNNWAWMNGDTISNFNGLYGTKCTMTAFNRPGARDESRAAWVDTNGNLWMFGGGIGGGDSAVWNDLWMYCVSANQWMWAGGDSTHNPMGSWGTKGIASPTNKPNGRAGSVSWTDKKNHLYFFGGTTTPFNTPYNDLWMYTIDPSCGSNCTALGACSVPTAFFSSDTSICQFGCINFQDLSIGATSWLWNFPGAAPATSTDQNPQFVCYSATGSYDVTLVVTNSYGSDTLTFSSYIEVHPAPATPIISQHNDTLFVTTDPSYLSYQWFNDTALILGATDTILVITHGGNYNISVTDTNGCSIAVGFTVGIKELTKDNSITLMPNPVRNELQITSESRIERIIIYNVLGEVLKVEEGRQSNIVFLNVLDLPAAIYYITVVGKKTSLVARFVKQ